MRFPHPVLLEDLADWRALATELSLTQGIAQLHRETFTRGPDVDAGQEGVSR